MAVILLVAALPWMGNAADSLSLKDLDGVIRTPLEIGGSTAAVLLFVTHDCPIANGYAPEYRRLREEYPANKISFTLVYVDPDAGPDQLRKHRDEYGLARLRAIHDRRHRLVAAVGAEITPEAVVLTAGGKIAYRGRVDNLYADYGKRRREATKRDLRNALDAVLAGKPVPNPRTEAIGCYIPPLNLP